MDTSIKSVGLLSPYAEMIQEIDMDMDKNSSKINSPFYDIDHSLGEYNQIMDFSSTSSALSFLSNVNNNSSTNSCSNLNYNNSNDNNNNTHKPNNNHHQFINGISTPLSNTTSTSVTPLSYTRDMIDFPSPSNSCISLNDLIDSSTINTTYTDTVPVSAPVSAPISTSISASNDYGKIKDQPQSIKTLLPSKNYTNVLLDEKNNKFESQSSPSLTIKTEEKSDMSTNQLLTTSNDPLLLKENPIDTTFPFNDPNPVSSTTGLLENYLNNITYPYYQSPFLPSTMQNLTTGISSATTTTTSPSTFLNSNGLFNSIVDQELYLKQMNQLLLLNQLTTMSSSLIPIITPVPLNTSFSLSNFSLPLSQTNNLSLPNTTSSSTLSSSSTSKLESESILNYIDFGSKVDNTTTTTTITTPTSLVSETSSLKKNNNSQLSSNINHHELHNECSNDTSSTTLVVKTNKSNSRKEYDEKVQNDDRKSIIVNKNENKSQKFENSSLKHNRDNNDIKNNNSLPQNQIDNSIINVNNGKELSLSEIKTENIQTKGYSSISIKSEDTMTK